MDLYAYSQIENLSELANRNGISIPRLRGFRLMREERPYSKDEVDGLIKDAANWVYDSAVHSCPKFHPDSNTHEYSVKTDYFANKYLIRDKEGETIGIRWDLIHGKHRKRIKFSLKKQANRIRKQYEVFNKYAGREDVLYIHARIGGGNWLAYGGAEISKQPWFLDKVDDYFDSTYCDIYAKINIL